MIVDRGGVGGMVWYGMVCSTERMQREGWGVGWLAGWLVGWLVYR